jgi:hypothetical protein
MWEYLKLQSFGKGELNSLFHGKYIHNNHTEGERATVKRNC